MPDDHPYYMDISHHPLAQATLGDLRDYPFPKGDDPGRFAGLRERALEIRQHTPYAVVSGISGVVYEICWYLRGLEQWFMDMLTQPEFCEALLDQTLKFWMDWFRAFLDEVGDVVDVIMIGDDLAAQKGPLFRPDFYRRVVKPRHKRLVAVHPLADPRRRSGTTPAGPARSTSRTCWTTASTSSIPCRSAPAGMDPAALKADFGERLVFWGGAIDAQHCLPRATPEEVRAAGAAEPGGLQARRRLCLQQRPQHPGRRPAGEHRGPVRRGLRVRVLRLKRCPHGAKVRNVIARAPRKSVPRGLSSCCHGRGRVHNR